MNAEQFENLLKLVKDMNEEQHIDLVDALRQHIIIPNCWGKMNVERVLSKDVGDKEYADFVEMANFQIDDDFDATDEFVYAVGEYFNDEEEEEETEEEGEEK
jgi:hypothetical protein